MNDFVETRRNAVQPSFTSVMILSPGTSLNVVRHPGRYAIDSPTNAPESGAFILDVIAGEVNNSHTVYQVLINVATGDEWTRLFVKYTGWASWLSRGSSSAVSTDLAVANRTGSTLDITSSTGDDVTLPAVTTSLSGLMTATDKTKLDGIAAGADDFINTDLSIGSHTSTALTIQSSTGNDAVVPAASTSLAGLMTAADKTKLDGIAAGADDFINTDLTVGPRTSTALTIESSTGNDVVVPAATNSLAGLLSATDTGKIDALVNGVGTNILINGDFQINRHGATGTLTAGSFFRNRWRAATGGAVVALSGFTLTLTSGEIEQVVESALWGYASLASLPVVVSVEAPSQDLTVTFGSQSGTITAGSGRRSVALTLGAGDTGNLTFKVRRSVVGSCTFGRIKVEIGSLVTAWEPRSNVDERLLCARYHRTTYNDGVAPGTVIEDGSLINRAPTSAQNNLTMLVDRFDVTMRAIPTITWYNPANGAINSVNNSSQGTHHAVASTLRASAISVGFPSLTSGTGVNAGDNFTTHYVAIAEL